MKRLWVTCTAVSAVVAYAHLGYAQPVSDLHRSKVCSSRSTMATAGGYNGNTEMKMSNEGGWCWVNLWARGEAATYRVTKAPDHGQLAMGEVNKRTRVAYKPDAGFVGEDRYTLMDTTSNSQRLVAVTVSK
jgi:hypothetical protein